MNPAVRAVVRTGLALGIEMYAVSEGLRGLVEGGELRIFLRTPQGVPCPPGPSCL